MSHDDDTFAPFDEPDSAGRLSEDEQRHLLTILDEAADSAAAGHPVAMAKLAELLVDDSLIVSFDPQDHPPLLGMAMEGMERALPHLGAREFWALCTALGREQTRQGAGRLLRQALTAGNDVAIEQLRQTIRMPGDAAERAADLLARVPDRLGDADLMAISVRALQSGRRGPARQLLEGRLTAGDPTALQAVRTMLWRHKPFVDEDHELARLQAALTLTRRLDLLAADDLPYLREAAIRAEGKQLLALYQAADQTVELKPPLAGAVETYAGIVSDAELGDRPDRGVVLQPLARPRVLQRFTAYQRDREARRALAPLALIWANEPQLQVEATRLLQQPALDGEHTALAAAASICARPDDTLLPEAAAQVLELLEAASRSGHAAETVTVLLELLQAARGPVGSRLFAALQRCARLLPANAALRTIVVQVLRELAHDARHAEPARAALHALVVSEEIAEEKTAVRAMPTMQRRHSKVRAGLSTGEFALPEDIKTEPE